MRSGGSRQAEIGVNDLDLLGPPAQVEGAVLQGALRLPGQLIVVRGLAPLLAGVGAVLPALVITTISHLLCLIPFVVLGAAVFARERIWATVVGLVLFFLLALALIAVWRFPGLL